MVFDLYKDIAFFGRHNSPFPNVFQEIYSTGTEEMKTLEEWNIIYISQLIREKPNWELKYKDETIVSKWKTEIKAQFEDKTCNFEAVWQFVIRELKWYEYMTANFPNFQQNGFKIGCDDRVIFSDSAVELETKNKLKDLLKDFITNEFSDGLDYHPGANNKVVDIVHPSLYPLQYERTPIYLEREGELSIAKNDAKLIKAAKENSADWGFSEDYQWLPSVMAQERIYAPNKLYRFASYINNLHPKYEDLYHTIESIFEAAIPGLNFCLSRLKSSGFQRIPTLYKDFYTKEWVLMEEEFVTKARENKELWDEYEEFLENRKDYIADFSPKYTIDPPVDYTFDLKKEFPILKTIVKFANIELTPQDPKYEGGSWHVEGTLNEDIVATILYYYDSENITGSRLGFRCTFDDPVYEQGDDFMVEKLYGLKDEQEMNKYLGDVKCQEDRLLIFPNCFQHKVQPFQLLDKTKPGHRKILCIFLVDPYNGHTITTAQVPPQQPWWLEQQAKDEAAEKANKESVEEKEKEDKFHFLEPPKFNMYQYLKDSWRTDLLEFIAKQENYKWPMSIEEAKEVRSSLMDQRKNPADDPESLTFTRTFSLCEH